MMLGALVSLRKAADSALFRTDQDNLILDADFGLIKQSRQLAETLSSRAACFQQTFMTEQKTGSGDLYPGVSIMEGE